MNIMSHKTRVMSQEIERVNPETGEVEIITSSKTWVQQLSGEEFFICYLPTYLKSLANCSPISYKILGWLMYKAFDNIVPMTRSSREECISVLNISQAHFYNGLSELLKNTFTDDKGQTQHFIIKEKGNIIINPLLSWRGNKSSREKALIEVEVNFRFN